MSKDPSISPDYESDPEEGSFEGRAVTVTGSSSKRPRDSPTSSEEVCRSTTAPEPVPTAITDSPPRPTFEIGGSSRPTKIRKTARKTVGRFPRRPLAPRDDSSEDWIDIPCDVVRPLPPGPAPIPWMTTILPRWRELEDLPSTYVAHAPITGEPIELTVPTLVGVCSTILQLMTIRHRDIIELQLDVARLEEDMLGVYGRFDIVEARHERDTEAANARMQAMETRQRLTTIALGVMVGLHLVSLFAGSFLPFWY